MNLIKPSFVFLTHRLQNIIFGGHYFFIVINQVAEIKKTKIAGKALLNESY